MAYADISKQNSALRFKATDGGVWVAPYTAAAVTSIVDAQGDFVALPTAYQDLGLLSDDGAAFGLDQTVSESTSWQKVSPTLSEITAETITLEVTAQETKALTLALSAGLTLPAADASGTVTVNRPEVPNSPFYRVIAIAEARYNGDYIYIARFFPRAQLTASTPPSFSKSDDGMVYGLTFTARPDSVLKVTEKQFYSVGAAAAAMGISPVTP